MSGRLTLRELGIEPADDAGTSWHPRPDKTEARDARGHLVDLDDHEVLQHMLKPETAVQPDAAHVLAAEDSAESPEGEV